MKYTFFVLTLMKRSALLLIFLALFVTFLTIDVHAQSYKRGVLVEDFTSQYCPYSPRGDHYIDSVCKLMPYNAVALVWHNGFIHDDFTLTAGDTVANTFILSGVPSILSNRITLQGTPEFSQTDIFYKSAIQHPATEDANVQIFITGKTYDYLSRVITCDVRISTIDTEKLLRSDTAQYYVAGVITEDSIVSWQRITCNGMIDDTTFTHNNVVRAVGGKIMGDNISLEHGSAILHYTFAVKGGWNPANIKIKAFVGFKSPRI